MDTNQANNSPNLAPLLLPRADSLLLLLLLLLSSFSPSISGETHYYRRLGRRSVVRALRCRTLVRTHRRWRRWLVRAPRRWAGHTCELLAAVILAATAVDSACRCHRRLVLASLFSASTQQHQISQFFYLCIRSHKGHLLLVAHLY